MLIRTVQIVNGMPRIVTIDVGGTSIYDELVTITDDVVLSGTAITLPKGQTYQSNKLEISLNEIVLTPGDEYVYVGDSLFKSQICFTFDLSRDDLIRFKLL
jgi:hypothetical protein